MESLDKEYGSAMGALFAQVITDMKIGAPLWEDFISKASKLHTALKSTLSVIGAYLDAFQKIADAATNAKGATKEIGTVLTRICLRHKAVEARLKTFTSALMECLVVPLQDKLEEWKKTVVNLDKEHAKESKKMRADIKKRTVETQRWQKKVKKLRNVGVAGGGTYGVVTNAASSLSSSSGSTASLAERQMNAANQELLRAADAAQIDLNSRLAVLQETEKQALRTALVEERSRYCLFVACLKPVMSEEMAMMTEFSHIEEIVIQLDKHTADPYSLPSSTEQMIAELKGAAGEHGHWSLQTPPSSPSSLSSRKSSMCSLGSIHSGSSGSVASHPSNVMQSPSHAPGGQQQHHQQHGGVGQHQQQQQQQAQQQQQQHMRHRSLSQVAGVNAVVTGGVRLSSVSSQDSGFTSQDTLVMRGANASPPPNQLANREESASTPTSSQCSSSSTSNSSTPCAPYPPGMGSTWPNLQETVQYDRAPVHHHHHHHNSMAIHNERPHTISTAYEKGHQRPALSVYTFQPLDAHSNQSCSSDKVDRHLNQNEAQHGEYETLRRCRELKASGNCGSSASSQESLMGGVGGGGGGGAGRPPLPQRCSSLERPAVPPPGPAKSAKHENKVNKKNALVLATGGPAPGDGQQAALPDFHMAAPDMIVPQPLYMNASELRQQQQQQQQQLNGDLASNDPNQQLIYTTSLVSCTIYDDGQACSCHDSTSAWRGQAGNNNNQAPRPSLLRRPASFSGYADPHAIQGSDWSTLRSTNGARMSTMRRTSVQSFATLHEVSHVDESQHAPALHNHSDGADVTPTPSDSTITPSTVEDIDLAALPPPPDFLLDSTAPLLLLDESLPPPPSPAAAAALAAPHDMILPPPPMGNGAATELIIPQRSLKVADAVKTLNEIRHQPASPGVVRRAQSMRAPGEAAAQCPVPPNAATAGLLAKGVAALGTTPKARRPAAPASASAAASAIDAHHAAATLNRNSMNRTASPVNHARTLPKHMPSQPIDAMTDDGHHGRVSGLLSKSSFVHQLNAKLAMQQQQHVHHHLPDHGHHHHYHHNNGSGGGNNRANNEDHHESLMDQIRRGTSLRRARSTSDRSSPHFKH